MHRFRRGESSSQANLCCRVYVASTASVLFYYFFLPLAFAHSNRGNGEKARESVCLYSVLGDRRAACLRRRTSSRGRSLRRPRQVVAVSVLPRKINPAPVGNAENPGASAATASPSRLVLKGLLVLLLIYYIRQPRFHLFLIYLWNCVVIFFFSSELES